jgi:hypothetical protein
VGPDLAGRPGRLYAKRLRDAEGRTPVPFWSGAPQIIDTRLIPGQPERVAFHFPPSLRRLRVRVLYRRFWHEVARAKGWPDRDLLVLERSFRLP